jgi:hypothetical protein
LIEGNGMKERKGRPKKKKSIFSMHIIGREELSGFADVKR